MLGFCTNMDHRQRRSRKSQDRWAVSSETRWAGLTQSHEVPSLLMETLQEDTPTPDIISLWMAVINVWGGGGGGSG